MLSEGPCTVFVREVSKAAVAAIFRRAGSKGLGAYRHDIERPCLEARLSDRTCIQTRKVVMLDTRSRGLRACFGFEHVAVLATSGNLLFSESSSFCLMSSVSSLRCVMEASG